ncbi:hypothetical protein [Burkholderia gladioli]|uniref:hypothetical protein n=1 Tax=Burkholderia gladioli TaxID=28095 RepID=UPI00164025CB|nr:hypothetical protein [Burkholderia gladioli]
MPDARRPRHGRFAFYTKSVQENDKSTQQASGFIGRLPIRPPTVFKTPAAPRLADFTFPHLDELTIGEPGLTIRAETKCLMPARMSRRARDRGRRGEVENRPKCLKSRQYSRHLQRIESNPRLFIIDYLRSDNS